MGRTIDWALAWVRAHEIESTRRTAAALLELLEEVRCETRDECAERLRDAAKRLYPEA